MLHPLRPPTGRPRDTQDEPRCAGNKQRVDPIWNSSPEQVRLCSIRSAPRRTYTRSGWAGPTEPGGNTVEQAFRDLCDLQVWVEGYELAYRMASDNLRLGLNVVSDSCNPIALTRSAWFQLARDAGAVICNIEVVCRDLEEHRRRVESRTAQVPGLKLPTWADVTRRDYEPWQSSDRLVIDTAGQTIDEAASLLLSRLAVLNDG